jgi:hypothetical protein
MHKSLMIFIIIGSTLSGVCQGAGSFGGLVVPNIGQLKGTIPAVTSNGAISFYMDVPWGRLYVTEQGLLLNITVPEKQTEGWDIRELAQAEHSGGVPVPAFPHDCSAHLRCRPFGAGIG